MGRELKRVALDFKWPLEEVWSGYLNPHPCGEEDCGACRASGYSPEARIISDDWYGFERPWRRWCYNITQDEVDALVEEDRLWDFTRRPLNDEQRANCYENGWTKEPNGYRPTAAEVNEWSRRGLGHDALNQHVCVKQRCKRLGVEFLCPVCKGAGTILVDPAAKALYDAWEPTEPRGGPGYQVWETVSEGSPISPVFATATECVNWLVGRGYSLKAAENFVADGWAPSGMMDGRGFHKDIESLGG